MSAYNCGRCGKMLEEIGVPPQIQMVQLYKQVVNIGSESVPEEIKKDPFLYRGLFCPGCSKAFCPTCCGLQGEICPECRQRKLMPAYRPLLKSVAAGGAAAGTGMAENVAGLLCYVLGLLTGLVFFLIDKRPFVRFHAAQSIVVSGGIGVLYPVLRMMIILGGLAEGPILSIVFALIPFSVVILWIICMVKAYQNKKFEVPVAADFAKRLAGE